jgi:hypothetical protein
MCLESDTKTFYFLHQSGTKFISGREDNASKMITLVYRECLKIFLRKSLPRVLNLSPGLFPRQTVSH